MKLSLLFVTAKRSITFSISGTISWYHCTANVGFQSPHGGE